MKTGSQKPTFEVVGKYKYSDGKAVAEVFAEIGGATFYPSQLYELELMLARNADGSPSASVIAISKPRQNGKSYAARYYSAYMAVFEHKGVLYSAHHGNTSRKMFSAMADMFSNKERFPDLFNEVKSISRARGYEGIYLKDWKDESGAWHDGGFIEFSTRTNSGARGGTYSVIVIDEAQEMTTEQQEAMLPVISAASDANDAKALPQQIYIGTPPAPSCNGTVFRKMRKSAKGNDGGIWWLEWGIESLDDLNAENPIELAYKTNPAMGYRIAEKTVMSEYNTMDKDGFARERLGWWSPVESHAVEYAIDSKAWGKCRSAETKPDGKTAYGVKFSADGASVALCGAVIPENGKARISLIKYKATAEGIRWLSDWLNERCMKASCVVIDGKNGVDVLIDRIADKWKSKGAIIRPRANDMIAAVSLLVDSVNEESLTWYNGQDVLNQSATTAYKRAIGGGYGFGGEMSEPVEACALALWGAKTSKRNPAKKMRIG